MTPNGLALTANDWLGRLGLRAAPQSGVARRPAARTRHVTVPSRYEEDERDDLHTASSSLSRATLKDLEKEIRRAGFKGAQVSGWSGPDVDGTVHSGFIVGYQGQQYHFGVDEVEPDTTGRFSPLHTGAVMKSNRGIYHQTGVGKDDLVIHRDHRGRYRVDLITTGSGNHLTIGPTAGYPSKSAAHTAAQEEQHRRGLRSSTIWVQQGDGYVSYEGSFERNGTLRYRFEEDTRDEGRWVSPEVFESSDMTHVRKGVVQGWSGSPRRAIEEETGRVLYGVDASGRESFTRNVDYNDNRKWTRAYIDGLPDSAFLYVNRSCVTHREGGRSHPLSCRHFPYKNQNGNVDLPHLRNALSRIPQSNVSATARREASEKAERLLAQHGGYQSNAPRTQLDEHSQRELSLFIENEYALIGADNSIGKAIDANLRKKVANGTYDTTRAPQAWQHLIDEGAKRYAQQFSTGRADYSNIFNAATRRAVAEDFARAWEAENGHKRNPPEWRPAALAPKDGPYNEHQAFVEEFDALLSPTVKERRVTYRFSPRTIFINFINLPYETPGAGGGAEAENNRMMFTVDGFGTARLKVEQIVSALPREYRLRAKTASPDAIARYLATFLNRVAAEVPPHFTHTRR